MVEGLPKLERVVVIPYIKGRDDIDLAASLPAECNATFFPDFVGDEEGSVPELVFEQVSSYANLVIRNHVSLSSNRIRAHTLPYLTRTPTRLQL